MRAVSEEAKKEEVRREKERYKSEHQLKVRTYHLLSILTAKSK